MRVLTSAALCALQQVGGDAEDAGGDRHDVLAGLVLDERAVTVQTALAVLRRAATTHTSTRKFNLDLTIMTYMYGPG